MLTSFYFWIINMELVEFEEGIGSGFKCTMPLMNADALYVRVADLYSG